jgi:hypothetical protein
MYKDTEKDVDIFKVIAYGHIPGVAEHIAELLSIEQQQGKTFKKRVEEFRSTVQLYIDSLFNSKYEEAEAEGKSLDPLLYWFELTQYNPHDWRMTNIVPHPSPTTQPYVVLPKDIIEELGENLAIDPDKVITIKGKHSKQVDKKVDLQVVRYSTNFIMGTVRDKKVKKKKEERPDESPQPGVYRQPEVQHLAADRAMAFRSFFELVKESPEEMKEVVAEILIKMLPKLKVEFPEHKGLLVKQDYSRYDFLNIKVEDDESEEKKGAGNEKK